MPSVKPFFMIRMDSALKRLIETVARRKHQSSSEWIRQAALRALIADGHAIPEPDPEDHEDDDGGDAESRTLA
jgi:predicted transcriptional regulator